MLFAGLFHNRKLSFLWPYLRGIFLLLVAMGMMVFFIQKTDITQKMRVMVTDELTPLFNNGLMPIHWLQKQAAMLQSREESQKILAKMEEELKKLTAYRDGYFYLMQENKNLRKLLQMAVPSASRVTAATILADNISPFSHSLLLDAGKNQGVAVGMAVTDHQAMVGRVLEVGENSARILLLTDPQSQISARFQTSGLMAIVVGAGANDDLSLEFTEKNRPPVEGERVVTSGYDGIIPPGILIGYVVKNEANWRIRRVAALSSLYYVQLWQRLLITPMPNDMIAPMAAPIVPILE
ncbi:MAG: rod shape-determining protein MreC [Alphaproteobacteria bacterium]